MNKQYSIIHHVYLQSVKISQSIQNTDQSIILVSKKLRQLKHAASGLKHRHIDNSTNFFI